MTRKTEPGMLLLRGGRIIDPSQNLDTVGDVVRAGAEVLVAGSAVFGKGSAKQKAQELLKAATEATWQKV